MFSDPSLQFLAKSKSIIITNMNPKILLFSALFLLAFSWQSGMGSKQNQQAVNQAFRINAQLDQWENSHIFPKPLGESLNIKEPNTLNISNSVNQTSENHQEPIKNPSMEALNQVDEEKMAKIKRQLFEERKKFAQEWVDKKNSGQNEQIKYFVNSMGKVDFTVKKKKKHEEEFANPQQMMEM